MKHPARHVSRNLRKVSRGRRELSRQVSAAVKKMKDDPSFQQLLRELVKRARGDRDPHPDHLRYGSMSAVWK